MNTSTTFVRPSPNLDGISPYRTPSRDPLIDLYLGATERTRPGADEPSGVLDSECAGRYPDSRRLESLIAAKWNVSADSVIVTAGANEALDRTLRSVLSPGRELIETSPTFEMVAHYGRLAGANVVSVPWTGGPYPLQEVRQSVTARTSAIVLVSPNNPTGGVASVGDVIALARAVPNILVIADLAYLEFADNDWTRMALDEPNIVVIRSLSKAYGVPGIRVGYALGNPRIIDWLRAAGGPYSVATSSVEYAEQTLACQEFDRYVRAVRSERAALEMLLRRLGADVTPSEANFVFVRFRNASWVSDALRSVGIGIRAFPSRNDLADARRITCPGDPARFSRLCSALQSALRPQAILFDLDGVLADVSRSYRRAILETARSYGVSIDQRDVNEAKSRGNANNDWELTRTLLSTRGASVPIGNVRDRFEQLYQGTPGAPGFYQSERLLVSHSLLECLSRRMPLGIVTGRPRNDALRFLRKEQIEMYFKSVICMEDAPQKPTPIGVQTALRQLGVRNAWMVGDTPDDAIAARGAGVVPIGFLSSDGDFQFSRGALENAGCARVIRNLDALLEVLS